MAFFRFLQFFCSFFGGYKGFFSIKLLNLILFEKSLYASELNKEIRFPKRKGLCDMFLAWVL